VTLIWCDSEDCESWDGGFCQASEIQVSECECYEKKPEEDKEFKKQEMEKLRTWNVAMGTKRKESP